MAGGEGIRLRPLTSTIPKPMVPIMNKPVLEHIIKLLKNYNINEIGITMCYLPDIIKEYFQDGKKFDVNIKYFLEEEPLGTGGSVLNAKDFLDDTFIVISGDAFTNINIKEAYDYHKNKNSKATLVLKRENMSLDFGIVSTDKKGKITNFLEKPTWGEVFSDTINTGIYILEPEILEYYKTGDKFDFCRDLFPKLLKDNVSIFGYITKDYWSDIGDLNSYVKTQKDILNGKVDNYKIEGNEINNGIYIGENTFIDKGVKLIPPVFIGNNCYINNGVLLDSYIIINDNCIINENSIIRSSIIWKNSYIRKNLLIKESIICDNSTIENNAKISEGAIIGTECKLESKVAIYSNSKIWPFKKIEKDTHVHHYLTWQQKASKNFFANSKIAGKINIGITPEFGSLLGSSLGTVLGKEDTYILSNDGFSTSCIISEAISSGVLLTGSKVLNITNVILPISRFAVRFYNAAGGIHISTDPIDHDKIYINFINKKGGNIDRNLEKSIKNLLMREDFQRCNAESIKKCQRIEDFSSFYFQSNMNLITNKDNIEKSNIKIMLTSPSKLVSNLAFKYLEAIGCSAMIACPNNGINQIDDYAAFLDRLMKNENIKLGVILNENGQHLSLIDENGEVINEDKYILLASIIALKSKTLKKIYIPFTTTRAAEELAKNYEAEIIRTKSSDTAILNELFNVSKNEEDSLLQYRLNFDGISAIGVIISFLVKNNINLKELINEIPDFFIKKIEIPCEFKERERIINQLIKESNKEKLELFEGVKINTEKGWSIVLPLNEKPIIKIYSESFNEEYAEEISMDISEKIMRMIKK